ncbi:MAG: DUF1573 domain-containing protein [Ignavibacteriaceae bacterium]|nr:DUF1573 domain-containing protein [Ignavibacteriaceae bacterium]
MIKNLLIIILFTPFIACAQLIEPRLVVQQSEYDFGDVKEGESVSHVFVLTNSGGDLLKITGVQSSCGCTAANPEKKELGPGESTNIKVTFNTKGRRGVQTKFVTITTNDANNPEVKLKITCNVVVPVSDNANVPQLYLPETQHDFGVVPEGKVVDYIFKMKNTGSVNLKIKDIKTSCGCTAALISSDELKPGEEGTLKVQLDTAKRNGRMSRTITITSNDPRESVKVLTIYADVQKGQ